MHGEHAEHDDDHFTREYWDERYGSADRLWSGRPNSQLVAQASDLTPGDALDVGSGEGADAIWLAARGWTVTAIDVSPVALSRSATQAIGRGCRDRGPDQLAAAGRAVLGSGSGQL